VYRRPPTPRGNPTNPRPKRMIFTRIVRTTTPNPPRCAAAPQSTFGTPCRARTGSRRHNAQPRPHGRSASLLAGKGPFLFLEPPKRFHCVREQGGLTIFRIGRDTPAELAHLLPDGDPTRFEPCVSTALEKEQVGLVDMDGMEKIGWLRESPGRRDALTEDPVGDCTYEALHCRGRRPLPQSRQVPRVRPGKGTPPIMFGTHWPGHRRTHSTIDSGLDAVRAPH